MYDDDDIYGDSSGMEDDLTGLTIVGGDLGGLDDNDEAAKWLAAMESDAVDSGDGASFQDELFGASTAADLQLGRISHVEPRIQAGIREVLQGGSLDGVHPVDLAAAREEFGSVIGGDPVAFASQIKTDEAVDLPRHPQDIKTVMSMIGSTAGNYLDRGPGGQLVNTYADEERSSKADEDLLTATSYIKELAGLYLDGRTVGSSVEGARRLALEESLTKRFIDGTFYEGSKDLLPLPNETGVTGIRATQGIYGTGQGTAQDRLSAASKFDHLYQTVSGSGQKTKFRRNDAGQRMFKDSVTQAERNEVLRQTPSLANSLFPKPRRERDKTYSKEELAKQKRDQKFNMEQAQYKADFARRILRQQMPTTRDESKGQIRMAGWDAPYDEQADLQNLRNEASLIDIDWNSAFAGQGEDSKQSELTEYIEQATELASVSGSSDEVKQGSQAWLSMRKGKITASTAAGLLKEGGVEERALDLAMERLGTSTPFAGNAHTREGNIGEEKALRAFLSGPGRGLTQTEETFIENPDYPGFGISPDGLLWDKEGNSAGLLELKYLSSGSMAGALNKYTPQMQMQMAITGEKQTNFYALDKYTGEYVHEVVKADPVMQAQLIEAGTKALELGAGLDNRGVRDLRKQIQSAAKPRKKLSLKKETGQTEAFVAEKEAEETMTAFDPNEATKQAVANLTASGSGVASETQLAKKLETDDQRERMKEAVESAKVDEGIKFDKVENQRKQAAARNAFVEGQRPQGGMEDAARDEMATFYKQQEAEALKAEKEKQETQKETTSNLRAFSNALKESAGVAAELGGLLTGGNQSGMSEVRLAAESGMTTEQARGAREAMELGGLDTKDASRVIQSAGALQGKFADQVTAASTFTSMREQRGTSSLAEVRNVSMPSLARSKEMNPQEWMSWTVNAMQGKSPEARAAIANMVGMPELAVYQGSADALTSNDAAIDEEGLRTTYEGVTHVEQTVREGKEAVGSLGENAGVVGAAAGVVGAVAGSKVVGAVSSKASTFLSKAATTGPKAAKAIKNLSSVGKATPAAVLASAAPMAIRAAGGIKDDGGFADSTVDVLEFAAYGAAAGSIVPGVGTMLGGAVGGALGLANEGAEAMGWDFWNADDAVPKADIGPMPNQTTQQSQNNRTDVNVTVTNEISPDLVTTTTDVNGDISVDEEAGLGTGGW